jgi:hypothetical protein
MLPVVKRVVVLLCLMGSVAFAVAPRWPLKRPTEVFLDTSRWPIVEAEITGTPVVPDAQDVRLVLPNDPSRAVTATSVREDEPGSFAITFLVEGTYEFLHNEDYGSDEHKFDMLVHFERAIDQAELIHQLPAGSEFNVVTYAKGAVVRVPWTPIASLRGELFGNEADYAGQTGNELIAGIEVALSELEKSHAHTKVLVVLSNGFDPSPKPGKWPALKRRMMSDRVHSFALVYKGSAKDADIARLTPQVVDAADLSNYLVRDLNQIIQETGFHFFATFDASKLPIDTKKPFELGTEVPGARTEPLLIDFSVDPPPALKPKSGDNVRDDRSLWPLFLVGSVVILALVVVVRRRSAR